MKHISVLEWPCQSLNVNRIENKYIYGKISDLCKEEEWNNISSHDSLNPVSGNKKHLEAVIGNKTNLIIYKCTFPKGLNIVLPFKSQYYEAIILFNEFLFSLL